MGIYKGNDFKIYIGGTAVANSTQCDVSISTTATRSLNTKDNPGFDLVEAERVQVTISGTHLFESAVGGVNAIAAAQLARTKVTATVGEPTPVAGEIAVAGDFIVDQFQLTGAVDGNVECSYTLTSSGTVTYTVGSGV